MSEQAIHRVIGLDAVSVSHRRGPETIRALQDVSVEFRSPTMTAIIGPSGSGKTTLLNLLLDAQRPDEGRVLGPPSSHDWSEMALVPQQLGLLDELSIGENVAFPLRFGPGRDPDELMTQLGIDRLRARLPSEVSLGEQQRAAVCRALVSEPAVLIADEPTSHQDRRRVELVAAELRAHADAGRLVLVATHDERIVEVCDRVLHLEDGRLVY